MKPTVVFQTDFGSGGGGVLAGVVKSIDAEIPVYDFNHDIQPYNIRQAAYELSTVVPIWPVGTIFVSVVDPGVGTKRRGSVALLTNGSYVISPDNGTLTLVADQIASIREIDQHKHRLPGSDNVHIFNGRDVFSYTAGKLAAGIISFEDVGPAYHPEEVIQLRLTDIEPHVEPGWAEGGIYDFDIPYGSARINIRNNEFQHIGGFRYGDHIRIHISDSGRSVYEDAGWYVRTFGDVAENETTLCGDIQLGEAQCLRLNTEQGFLQTYAPELLTDLSGAVSYVVHIEQLD